MRSSTKGRRRAALVVAPLAVVLISTSSAAAQSAPLAGPDSTPEATTPEATTAKKRDQSKLGVKAKRHVHVGSSLVIRGKVAPRGRRWVTIRAGGGKLKSVRTRANGRYRLRWRPRGAGVYKVSARVSGNGEAKPARSRSKRVNVYRPAQASYYGPGLYGGATACGGTLQPGTLGVANKTLPCGTKVTLRHGNRSVTVPVIDRGPYVGNREFDLTTATKNKIGFGSTGVVWTTR